MRGFVNANGTTCYLAAALQCMLHSPQLVNYLLTQGCAAEDVNNRKKNASALTKAIIDLAKQMWTEPDDGSPLRLAEVGAALGKHSKTFAAPQYQDAHECMLALIDGLHQGLSKMKPLPMSIARNALLAAGAEHIAAWNAAAQRDYSFLTEIFQGQMLKNGQYEHFWSVSLNLASGESLQQLLAEHFYGATVTYTPLLFIIQLNRFTPTGEKIDKFINYGLFLPFGGSHYRLYAVCLHRDAHYTAICENHGQWTHFNDAHVETPVDPNAIIQKDAYILLFKKDDLEALET